MMTTKELEQVILELIRTTYCKEYTGRIKVIETFDGGNHLGYRLELGLNKDERPLSIAGEGSDKEFLSFIERELKDRSLDRTEYFTAIQIYNTDECKEKC